MPEVLKNNAASTLSAAVLTTIATVATVANGTVFPATGNFRILIDSELMLCTARTGNVLTVTRGVESTVAATHSNGAAVTHILTTGGLDQYIRENALSLVPAAHVYHNANQAIATATGTMLAFNSERFDTDVIHDNTTNNSRLTCKTAGKYLIVATINWATNATGVLREVGVFLNNTTILGQDQRGPTSTSIAQTAQVIWDLAVNDFVECRVGQDSGGNLNVLATNSMPSFSMVRVA